MLLATNEANEYRMKFHQYCAQNIAPIMEEFEEQRKIKCVQQKIVATISIPLCVVSLLLPIVGMCLSVEDSYMALIGLLTALFFALGVGGVAWASFLGSNFENLVKDTVMQNFLSFFGSFAWKSQENVPEVEIQKFRLMGEFYSHDYFEGLYKNLRLIFSSGSLVNSIGKNETSSFYGFFAKIELHKNVSAQAIITEKGAAIKMLQAIYNIPQIILEDTEFDELFDVYSHDQVEARYILNPAFMERFKQLRSVFKSKHVRALFVENSFYVILSSEKRLFKLVDLRKPMTDSNQIQEFFEQFVAILSIIDILKLDLS